MLVGSHFLCRMGCKHAPPELSRPGAAPASYGPCFSTWSTTGKTTSSISAAAELAQAASEGPPDVVYVWIAAIRLHSFSLRPPSAASTHRHTSSRRSPSRITCNGIPRPALPCSLPAACPRLLHSAVSPDSWNAEVRFDCFLVALRDAAAPGPRGLLHPLLRRYREGAASLATFSLPAVQVGPGGVLRMKVLEQAAARKVPGVFLGPVEGPGTNREGVCRPAGYAVTPFTLREAR